MWPLAYQKATLRNRQQRGFSERYGVCILWLYDYVGNGLRSNSWRTDVTMTHAIAVLLPNQRHANHHSYNHTSNQFYRSGGAKYLRIWPFLTL